MPDFDEKQIMEALGVEPETPAEGENKQDPAAPADQDPNPNEDKGEKKQGPAAPASEEGDPEDDDQDQDPAGDQDQGGQPTGKEPMSPEERKAQAAARRKRETDEAVQRAVQAERDKNQAEMSAFFQAAQLKNTFTGKPITSMEEFNEWKRAFDAAQTQKDLKAGKLTLEALGKAIEQTPAMQKVQEFMDQQGQTQKAQADAAFQQKVNAELAEIQKLDPSIKTVEDLLKMPTAKEFYAYVAKHGLSYIEAFRLANQNRLDQQVADAARQQAMSNARGKDHMTSTKPQGGGSLTVPDDELAMFRLMNPDATDAEIQAYYNKTKKA